MFSCKYDWTSGVWSIVLVGNLHQSKKISDEGRAETVERMNGVKARGGDLRWRDDRSYREEGRGHREERR